MPTQKILERSVPLGDSIHGRTARTIVSIVTRHGVRCDIGVPHPSRCDASGEPLLQWADGRSILSIMSLEGAVRRVVLTLRVEGERADDAMKVLAEYIEFGPYTFSRGGTNNSDPYINTLSYDERMAYLEVLSRYGAVRLGQEHLRWRQERDNPQLRVEREAEEARKRKAVEDALAAARAREPHWRDLVPPHIKINWP